MCVCVNFLRAPLENTTCLLKVPKPNAIPTPSMGTHGRFKPRSELGRLEVGGGGDDLSHRLVTPNWWVWDQGSLPKNGRNIQLKGL